MIELLAPAGNMSKLRTAFDYGADAVYIGGGAYSLRANADNFTLSEIAEAVSYANSINKKVYVTANIIARNEDLDGIARYAEQLSKAGVHGVIVSDPGVFITIKTAAPEIPIHISTQANNLNFRTCEYWYKMGAVRVNLARELTISEISDINASIKADGCPVELEAFVHGAMCMSYSGRCMLSDYFTSRSSNRGDCAQPCRWNYGLATESDGKQINQIKQIKQINQINAVITEPNRPGEHFDVMENERGTFIFNSKDLCMIDHLKELKDAGVTSFKIEGRMKSEFYVAVTVRAYRIAIDALERGEPVLPGTDAAMTLIDELLSVSHRDYSTGFYLGERGKQIYDTSSYKRDSDFIGTVDSCIHVDCAANYSVNCGVNCEVDYEINCGVDCVGCDKYGNCRGSAHSCGSECDNTDSSRNGCYIMKMTQRGSFSTGDTLEFVPPPHCEISSEILKHTVTEMYDEAGQSIERAPHAMMKVIMRLPFRVPERCIIRRRR